MIGWVVINGLRAWRYILTRGRCNHVPMDDEQTTDLVGLQGAADRLDGLADTAELMGDPDGSRRLREAAATARLRAMRLLDDA